MIPSGVYRSVTIGVSTIGILANILLIFLARYVKSPTLGEYSSVVTIFACFDMTMCILNAVLLPTTHSVEYGHIMFLRGIAGWDTTISPILLFIFLVFFHQTFIMVAYHFIYRYVSVACNVYCPYISYRKFWYLLGVSVNVIYLASIAMLTVQLLPTHDSDAYFKPILQEIYGINASSYVPYMWIRYVIPRGSEEPRYNPTHIVCVSAFTVENVFIATTIIYSSYSISQMIGSLSQTSRISHRQILRALLVQTTVPMLSSFLPVGFAFISPMLGIKVGTSSNYIALILELFPAIDPMIIIFFVKPYRNKLERFGRKLIPVKTQRNSSYIMASLVGQQL